MPSLSMEKAQITGSDNQRIIQVGKRSLQSSPTFDPSPPCPLNHISQVSKARRHLLFKQLKSGISSTVSPASFITPLLEAKTHEALEHILPITFLLFRSDYTWNTGTTSMGHMTPAHRISSAYFLIMGCPGNILCIKNPGAL